MGLGVILAGCGRDDIKVYQVPKEKAVASPPPMAANTAETASAPGVKWKLPAGWEELPAGQMRVGNFLVKGKEGAQAQVTIVPLAGTGGGDLDNVNRWRSQVGLGPISREQMTLEGEPIDIAGERSQVFNMCGTPADQKDKVRILAAAIRRGDTAWFFKMTGSDSLVNESKPVFVEFLKSISFGAGSSAGTMPAMPMDTAASSAPATGSDKPAWTVPESWREQAPGAMQKAKYLAEDKSGGKVEITVVVLGGEGGGMLPNVNRWRGQIGLAPIDAAELPKISQTLDLVSGKATLVAFNTDDNKKAMRAVIAPRDGQTWFFKMVGDGSAVTAQKDAFTKFLESWK